MNVEQVKQIVVANGISCHTPNEVKEDEKFVLTIEADHNDGDYETKVTVFKVDDKFDLVELLNVLKVLRKLQQADVWNGTDDNWHMEPMYRNLPKDDIKILFDYDAKHDETINDIEEYSLFDNLLYSYDSTIRSWFPDAEFESDDCICGNHSLISIKLQYNDGNGNLLNIEL